MSEVHHHGPSIKKWLHRFFSFHDPSQLNVVDGWLKNWQGREEEMKQSLIRYHGAEPPTTYTPPLDSPPPDANQAEIRVRQQLHRECRALLQQLVLFYSPEEILSVDEIMHRWSTREDVLLQHLEKIASRRDSIFRFFERYDSTQMAYAVQLCREWLGQEPHLLVYLETHNGKAPTRALQYPPVRLLEHQRVALARERLLLLLRQYQPQRLVDADAMLEAFRGREEEMFGMLIARYGQHTTGGSSHQKEALVPVEVITSDFGLCVQTLAEAWLPESQQIRVETVLGQLLGTEMPHGEVLLRLAAEVEQQHE